MASVEKAHHTVSGPGARSRRPIRLNVMDKADLSILQFLQGQYQSGNTLLFNHSSLLTGAQYLHLYEVCRQYVTPGSRVLDWGAGNGHFSCFLARGGYQATRFSFDPYSYRFLVSGYSYHFVPGGSSEPSALPFQDCSFDAVFSIGALEHVRETGGDELASLAEIRRVLKPRGHFICYHLPNRYSWIEATVRILGKGFHYHRHRYTASDIERLCVRAGLDLIQLRRYAFLPRQQVSRLMSQRCRRSASLAVAYSLLDRLLERVFSPVCQNYCFVARR